MACLFFFNDTATTEIYTLSLHDALPICLEQKVVIHCKYSGPTRKRSAQIGKRNFLLHDGCIPDMRDTKHQVMASPRSEEHTSELQSRQYLVCRLLLEKKKTQLSCTAVRH